MDSDPSSNSGPNVGDQMSAGCSKFPSYTASNQNGIFAMDQTSPPSANQQQISDSAFPSPPSTSTSSQPNIPTNLITANRSQPPQSKSANVKPTVQTPSNSTNRPSSGNFFNFLFRGRKSDSQQNFQNFISNEGSITASAWQMMSKQANTKVRLRTLETLSKISKQRKLQVSTLEGIWSETRDLLDNPACRQPFLNLIYNITVSQIKEIGLALRLTFFETIRSIGLSDVTVRWLTALSDRGKIIEPFEVSIAELLSDWLEKVVVENDKINAGLAPEVIQLCANLICHQNAFVDEESLSRIIRCCCKRIVRGPGDQLSSCLTLLEAIFEHSIVSKSELFLLISTLCFIVCLDIEADKTWKLFNFLLTSDHSYAVLAYLQSTMRSFVSKASEDRQEVAVQIARGAVHALAQALWGTKRIDSLNCSPCVVLPAFEEAMYSDVLVARQVMYSIRRLIVKHGKTLQLFNWTAVIKLLRSAVHLCGEDVETAAVIKHDLHSIISLVESLIDQNKYTGSREEFYVVLEESVIDRPDCSALNLLDYRIGQLTPEQPNWIDQVHSLLNKFLYEGVSLIRREKSVYVMHNFYKRWRILYEPEILKKIVLPICTQMVPNEREVSIQYYLICVLFDAAKVAKINVEGSNELYLSILNAIGSVFNNGISLDNDNLEVSACLLAELLDERFAGMTLEMVDTIFNFIIRHLELHYIKNGSTTGCEVRMRLFETLLLFQSHPLNGQIARVLILSPSQFQPVYNPQIIRAGSDTQGQFKWSSICEITTLALQTEIHWPTLERILEFLSGTIEHRFLVYTAGVQTVNKLVDAVLKVVNRVEERYPLLPKAKLARYLCPVLGKLVNYTPTHDNQICKIIVQLVRSGCPQAIMAADAAVQVLPEKMALFNRSLLENLAALKPMAQLAIPIIELLADAADIPEFHAFFTEKHYKIVINLLVPYSNARQFNAFIVTSVYQTAMRWFLCVPMSIRGSIAAQMFGSFARTNNLFPLQKPRRTSESPEADTSEKTMVKMAASLMTKDLPDPDSHPTALIITPSKKRSNIKKSANNLQEQTSLESEITAATTVGEFFLQSMSDLPKGLEKRNASGDGRQPIYELPFEDPTPLFSTGDTVSLETDSIGDFRGVNELAQQILTQEYAIQQQQDSRQVNKTKDSFAANLTIELLENLNYFIRFFRTKTADIISAFSLNNQQPPSEININKDLVEKLVENWVVDGTILTLRVLIKPEPVMFGLHSRRIATISVDRLDTNDPGTKAGKAAQAIRSMSRDKKRTNTTCTITNSKQRNTSITSKESDDLLRRRHQSTKASTSSSVSPQKVCRNAKELSQPPEEVNQFSGRVTPNSDLDDVFFNPDVFEDKTPEWFQLVIRHVFGKESYVMRSFSDVPLDFDNALGCANNCDPNSLLLHLRGNNSAVRLVSRDNDLIARSLRFLDTMPSEELHEVSVIYLREDNHASMNDVLMTEYGSDRFVSFVRRLGKACKSEIEKTDFCYEHVDLLQRVRFHISTLIPCSNEVECEEKRRVIENSTICVIFNESGTPCKLSQLFRKNDQVVLEVTPQDNSTVTINMHARREVAWWLAMTRALLPDCQAAHVLRKMIVRAQRSLRCWTSMTNEESAEMLPYLGCAVERQRHVHKLRKRGIAEPF